MSDKNSEKNSDEKKDEQQKANEKNSQKVKREIPDVEKNDRITLPEMRIDFDTDQKLSDE